MADIYGTDIAQTTVQDWRVTATSDVATISGLENLQQALERRWGTRMGALFYDPSYGNPIFDMLSGSVNQNWINQATIAARSCLMGDSRIIDAQVMVTPNPATRSVLFSMLWTANDGTTGTLQKEVSVGV